MSDLSMIIAGERHPTEKTFDVINPATGEVFAQAPDCSKEQLDAAFDAAKKAQIDWRRDDDARRALLLEAANKLFAVAGEIGPILTEEQGQPLSGAPPAVSPLSSPAPLPLSSATNGPGQAPRGPLPGVPV